MVRIALGASSVTVWSRKPAMPLPFMLSGKSPTTVMRIVSFVLTLSRLHGPSGSVAFKCCPSLIGLIIGKHKHFLCKNCRQKVYGGYAALIKSGELFWTEFTALDTGRNTRSLWVWVDMISFRASAGVSALIQSSNASGIRITGIL